MIKLQTRIFRRRLNERDTRDTISEITVARRSLAYQWVSTHVHVDCTEILLFLSLASRVFDNVLDDLEVFKLFSMLSFLKVVSCLFFYLVSTLSLTQIYLDAEFLLFEHPRLPPWSMAFRQLLSTGRGR